MNSLRAFLLFLFGLLSVLPAWGAITVGQDGAGDFNGKDEGPILAAIEKARKAGGGEIVIRAGEYLINKGLILTDAKRIVLRGEPGAVLKLPPIQRAEMAEAVAPGVSEVRVKVQQGLVAGLKLRFMADGALDSFSGKRKPTFFVDLERVDGDRMILKKPLEFAVPAGTQIMNEDAPNLLEVRKGCEEIVLSGLIFDGGRTPDDPPIAAHAQLCGIFASGLYNYTEGPKGPPVRALRIRDCTVRNFFGRGVAFYSVAESEVSGCTIEDCVDEAVDLDHFTVGCRVLDNRLARCRVGVELNDANECWVGRNRIEACETGINLWRWCKFEDLNVRNQIVENLLLGMKANGLQLAVNTRDNLVRGNVIRGSGRNGISLNAAQTMVTGNLIQGCGQIGITVAGDENEVSGNRITGSSGAEPGKSPLLNVGGNRNRVLDNWLEAPAGGVAKAMVISGKDITVREGGVQP